MKLALISDIHANLEALEAILKDIEALRADAIHCLGDVIGYGCDPGNCLQLVNDHCETKLLGNHEYAAMGLVPPGSLNQLAQKTMDWTTTQLTDYEFSMIADFDMDTVVSGCRLVHASPNNPDDWHYLLTPEDAIPAFNALVEPVAFFGHTHLPMIFSRTADNMIRHKVGHDFDPDDENRYLINVGSVGQPRDNDPRACYVIFDDEIRSVTFHRVEYDVKTTQAKMARAKIPKMLIERLEVGR